jgi:simple sugar transport system permease protein
VLAAAGGAFVLWYAVTDNVPDQLVSCTPYVVTLVVLAVASQRLRPPAAAGLPYRKGQLT